ncbi:MAG: hypothetical protein R3E87_12270 [Burkholderiaceae bacterium]
MSAASADGDGGGEPLRTGSLVVFADDWGRHPSSAQHLIARLPARIPVLWVNTIGTRAMRFDAGSIRRALQKLVQWLPFVTRADHGSADVEPGSGQVPSAPAFVADDELSPLVRAGRLQVVAPIMWPGFASAWSRRLNAWLLARQLAPRLAAMPAPLRVLTTLPLVADLPPRLPPAHWLYYCVDDFGVWPGYDGDTMRTMERDLVPQTTASVAVSEHLVEHLRALGATAQCLTHGVDLAFWRRPMPIVPSGSDGLPDDRPLVCFWGVIDRRLDAAFVRALAERLNGHAWLVLIGPREDPDPALLALPAVRCLPAQPLSRLPSVAMRSAVLVMPYVDAPVTHAMQPLKLKEYLATDRPVVVRALPATRAWTQACDVCSDADEFARVVLARLQAGSAPREQLRAREALTGESWRAKSAWLADWIARNGGERATGSGVSVGPVGVQDTIGHRHR